MSDPCDKTSDFSRSFQLYVEKHRIYEIFQEVFKELILYKPENPLEYINDQFVRIASGIDSPRTFILGPPGIGISLAETLAMKSGAVFLTFDGIITESPNRNNLEHFLQEGTKDEENALHLKQLVDTINQRISMDDCVENGYILFGFPRNKSQAILGQKVGLLPRQVLILEPESPFETKKMKKSAQDLSGSFSKDKSKGIGPVELKKLESKSLMVGSSEETKMTPSLSDANLFSETDMRGLKENEPFFKVKDIQSAYVPDICKVYRYAFWNSLEKPDLEMELYSSIITKRSQGVPLIPKVLLIGFPGAHKSKYADYLENKFGLVNVNWHELIRGAALWNDETAEEARAYLSHGTQLSTSSVALLLNKILGREDALKRGWVLQGFPESEEHVIILDQLLFTPNRIFFISITEELSKQRLILKGETILSRGFTWEQSRQSRQSIPQTLKQSKEKFPYSEKQIDIKINKFIDNIPFLKNHYGNLWILVDGSQADDDIKEYIEASILSPQTIKFQHY